MLAHSSGPLKRDPSRKRSASVLRTLHRIGDWLKRDDEDVALPEHESHSNEQNQAVQNHFSATQTIGNGPMVLETDAQPKSQASSLLDHTMSKPKKVIPELPRRFTSKRQNSEKRERLLPVETTATERRAMSADRRPRAMTSLRCQSPIPAVSPTRSAPDVNRSDFRRLVTACDHSEGFLLNKVKETGDNHQSHLLKIPSLENMPPTKEIETLPLDDRELQAELEAKWILNLSMHFRDKSDREKFFVTYAQESNRWRRVTISCDYRDTPANSLEADLKSFKYQRDKSQRIYEAIRDSLPDIQFYDTVTNLKLETEDEQLHVHVTEDVNEIIAYPSTSLVDHINCDRYRESELDFQSHLSGFVYKISADNRILIKKEIPGPDTIDEFLYEVEALHSLRGSKSVIDFHGLVVSEDETLLKGLLISFASLGALVDIIYDYKSTNSLPWHRRERWAYQIVRGLSEIHEASFVQGDFTLSNIVIDSEDDAKIIDINRRGCPIGWEPPELLRAIRSGQRISMRIGVKSDIFQLGMVLWALAQQHDEPEHVERSDHGMPPITSYDVPAWFRNAVEMCLSKRPQDRPSAKQLLSRFPLEPHEYENKRASLEISDDSFTSHHSHKEFIDPATTVDRDDIEEFKRQRKPASFIPSYPTTAPSQFIDLTTSTEYRLESAEGYMMPHRGRSPYGYRRTSAASSTTSLSLSEEGFRCEYSHPEGGPNGDHILDVQHPHDLQQRPSLPDAPPYCLDRPDDLHDASGNGPRQPSKHATFSGEYSSPSTQQHVLFGPPVHQDSGFDEYMTEAIDHGQLVPLPQQSAGTNRRLPPILTMTAESLDGKSEKSSVVKNDIGS